MKIKDKIQAFAADYLQQSSKITTRIEETQRRLADLSLEIRFIQEKEIPEAVERRILAGDDSQEKKLRRSLEKLQAKRLALSEEALVLQNVLAKFKQDQANKVQALQKPLQDEIRVTNQTAYAKMMAAKREYEDVIRRESVQLRDLRNLDVQLQEIEVEGGRRPYVYSDLAIQSAANPGDQYRFNNVYLPLSYQEISKLIKSSS